MTNQTTPAPATPAQAALGVLEHALSTADTWHHEIHKAAFDVMSIAHRIGMSKIAEALIAAADVELPEELQAGVVDLITWGAGLQRQKAAAAAAAEPDPTTPAGPDGLPGSSATTAPAISPATALPADPAAAVAGQ